MPLVIPNCGCDNNTDDDDDDDDDGTVCGLEGCDIVNKPALRLLLLLLE